MILLARLLSIFCTIFYTLFFLLFTVNKVVFNEHLYLPQMVEEIKEKNWKIKQTNRDMT